jgi:thioredoxin-related protein/tetratricopeptide (TPR) repeat protein
MRIKLPAAILSIVLASLAACSADKGQEVTAENSDKAAAPQPEGIPWFQGGIEEAFAQAKAEDKPLFLYWGAEWCPYCKELEATIFVRDEFIRMSRQFIPLDMSNGDSGTILYADQFKIYGLPTVIVFNPAGDELTRIRGGMNIDQYASVLELTLNEVRPVATLVAAAREGETLQPADWQLLADYSWGQDRGQALGEEHPSGVLMEVLAACPLDDELTRSRLSLAALAVWFGEDEEARDADLAVTHLAAVERIIADPELAQANLPMLAGSGIGIVELAEGEQQQVLQQSLLALYRPAVEDEQRHLLKRASVLSAWAEVATALLAEGETLGEADIAWARENADAFVAALDAYQVHAGVNSLWGVYYDIGLEAEARNTLALGIEKSRAPFYFMSGMGYIEVQKGNNTEALDWYRKAWEATSNPVDRVRWGGGYVRRLFKLAPEDTAEIERATSKLLADLTSQDDAFEAYERSIKGLGKAMLEWSAEDAKRQEVVAAIREQMDSSCTALASSDPGRTTCEDFLKPAAA